MTPYQEGVECRKACKGQRECQYSEGSKEYTEWMNGYSAEKQSQYIQAYSNLKPMGLTLEGGLFKS